MLSEGYILDGLRRLREWSARSLSGPFLDSAAALEMEFAEAEATVANACRCEHVLLYGSAGCGKSTLTNVLSVPGLRVVPGGDGGRLGHDDLTGYWRWRRRK